MNVILWLIWSVLPLEASSFVVHTKAGTDQCDQSSANPVACSSSASTASAGGNVVVTASYNSVQLLYVAIQFMAVCHSTQTCLNFQASGSATRDMVVYGQPEGTPGLIEFVLSSVSLLYSTSSSSITGLTPANPLGPHGGSLYQFRYGMPFQLHIELAAGCSECETFGILMFKGPGYIYDMDMNLLGVYSDPVASDEPVPEPASLLLVAVAMFAGLSFRRRPLGAQ